MLARIALLTLSLGLVLLLAVAHATPAHAFSIADFKAGVLTDADNDSSYFQTAGGRPPFGVTDFTFATDANGEPVGNAKNLRIDIPQGLVPNFPAIPTCSDAQLESKACPADSQIGVQRLTARGSIALLALIGQPRQTIDVRVPIYNLERGSNQVARFGFNPAQAPSSELLGDDAAGTKVNLAPVIINGGVRNSDYGLYFTISSLPTNPATVRSDLIFWGVPGAASHDAERGQARTDLPGLDGTILEGIAHQSSGGNVPVSDKTTAFLTNPTSCSGKQTSTVHAESYTGETADSSYTTPVGVENCDQVPFNPSVSYGPGTVERDSPTPFDVHLQVPQTQNTPLGTAHAKKIAVTLPSGVSISPSAATGLQACTDAQFGKGTEAPIGCPAGSKVGSVKITTPVLDGPLNGSAYIGQPLPGNRYRLFINADGFGITLRLVGTITPDPTTGQLTATFDDNPQLPFSDLEVHFDGGPHGVIASPQSCGGYAGNTAYSPWSGTATVNAASTITSTGCTDGFGFKPTFGAAAGSPQAGAYTPLTVSLGRPDGDQYLSGVSVTLPPGQLAKLKGVTQCSDAQIAAESCPAESKIGDVTTKAGPGSDPFTLGGSIYLTGAYGGGQFGAVVIIRAIAGPYDLGNVVVRQSISIDPNDTHVTITSDPLPQIKEGIPLRVRDLTLNINRPGFTRNATSCDSRRVVGALQSLNGAQAWLGSDFGFSGCSSEQFGPKLALALRNKSEMGKNKHPQVRATLTQKDNEAGIKSTSVALPKSVALAADNANGLCETAQAAVDKCPKASIVGNAVAETPILNKSLKGPVYFVKGERKDPKTGNIIKTLPTLHVPLRGEATVILKAETAVSHGRLVTTFSTLPDAPITKFTLTINGGKHGIIATTRNICTTSKSGLKASVRFVGHNGKKAATQKPTLSKACSTKKATKKKSSKKSSKTSSKKKTTKKKSSSRAADATATAVSVSETR